MKLATYIEQLENAWADKDMDTIKKLEAEYGNKQATYHDVDEALAGVTRDLMMMITSYKKLAESQFEAYINILEDNKVLTPKQINDLRLANDKIKDDIETYLKGEE